MLLFTSKDIQEFISYSIICSDLIDDAFNGSLKILSQTGVYRAYNSNRLTYGSID